MLKDMESLEQEGEKASSLSCHSKTMGSITQAIRTVLDVNTNVIINIFHKHKQIKPIKMKMVIKVHHASHIGHPNNIGYSFVIHPTVSTIFYI